MELEHQSPPSGGSSMIHHMIAGAVAGTTEHCGMFPVDTIKVRVCVCVSGSLSLSLSLAHWRYLARHRHISKLIGQPLSLELAALVAVAAACLRRRRQHRHVAC